MRVVELPSLKLLPAVLGAVLVVASCSEPGDDASEVSVAVKGNSAASLQVDDAFRVDLPTGATQGDGTLIARRADSEAVPRGLRAVHPVWDVTLEQTGLVSDAMLSWKTPQPDAGPSGALPVYFDEAAGRWAAADAAASDSGTVVARTSHFSRWTILGWDPNALTGWLTAQLKQIAAPDPAAGPRCPDEQGAKDSGVKVASSNGDLVRWCVGRHHGETVLQVTNNRGYALSVEHPRSWRHRTVGAGEPLLDSIASQLGKVATPDARTDWDVLILAAGRTVEFTTEAGEPHTVVVEPSPPAFLGSALVYAAQTFANAMNRVPGGPQVSTSKTTAALKNAIDNASCFTSLQKQASADTDSADDLFEVWKVAVEVGFGCLRNEWERTYGLDGLTGAFVMNAITWLADGVGLVVQGGTAIKDTLTNIGGYRISVQLPQDDTESFVGRWYVHGGSMVINEDLTAINKNANNADGYYEVIYIQFAHSGTSDVLVGTITNVDIEPYETLTPGQKAGLQTDPPPLSFAEGQTVTVKLVNEAALYSRELGNPNLCREGVEPATVDCGA